MIAFIKDEKTFNTKSTSVVIDYKIKPSIYDTVSEIKVIAEKFKGDQGDWLYLDQRGWLGIISGINSSDGITTLKCRQAISYLRRDLIADITANYIEDHIAGLISTNYTNCTDSFYRRSYIQPQAITHTAGQMIPDIDDSVFNIASFTSKARRLKQIYSDFEIAGDQLRINIQRKNKTTKNIDFDNPRYIVTDYEISAKTVGKITAINEDTGTTSSYYLLKDGTISTSSSSPNRVEGEWIVVRSSGENMQDKVQEEFLKNSYCHNVSFIAPRSSGFELYDPLTIKIEGKIYSSYVSETEETKNSDSVNVTCGELQILYPYLNMI